MTIASSSARSSAAKLVRWHAKVKRKEAPLFRGRALDGTVGYNLFPPGIRAIPRGPGRPWCALCNIFDRVRMSVETRIVIKSPPEFTRLGIVGTGDVLGNWDIANVVRLQLKTPNPSRQTNEGQANEGEATWATEPPLRVPIDAFPLKFRVVANGGRESPNARPLIWDQASRWLPLPPQDGTAVFKFNPTRDNSDNGWVHRAGAGAFQLRVGQPPGSLEPLVDLVPGLKDVLHRVDLWETVGRDPAVPEGKRFKRLKYAHTGPLADQEVPAAEDDNAVIFLLNAQSLEALEFRVDVTSTSDGSLLARGYVPAACLTHFEGTLSAALISPKDLSNVGTFRAAFLVVTEMIHPVNNLKGLQRSRWLPNAGTLDIGHRGSGASKVNGHSVRENTLLSFEKAALNHSEFIEFDVHLSADGVPVIHHDFQVRLAVAGDELSVAVPTLTAEQLCSDRFSMAMITPTEHGHRGAMHGEVTRRASTLKRTMTSAEEFIHSIFHKPQLSISPPTNDPAYPARAFLTDRTASLRDAFRATPSTLGFNIELKYPTEEEATAMGARFYSRNAFVDAVLRVVLKEAGNRRVIFSSFDPDCATLLSLKQPRYPVLFLTCGGTKVFADPRMNSLEAALRFALASRLQGVVAEVSSVLDRLEEIVTEFHSRGLFLFTYGELNNDMTHYLAQKQAGVDAVILDDVARIAHATNKSGPRFLGLFGSTKSLKSPSSLADLQHGLEVSVPTELPVRELDRISASLTILAVNPVGSPTQTGLSQHIRSRQTVGI